MYVAVQDERPGGGAPRPQAEPSPPLDVLEPASDRPFRMAVADRRRRFHRMAPVKAEQFLESDKVHEGSARRVRKVERKRASIDRMEADKLRAGTPMKLKDELAGYVLDAMQDVGGAQE